MIFMEVLMIGVRFLFAAALMAAVLLASGTAFAAGGVLDRNSRVGDVVRFGEYMTTYDGLITPIEWRVIDVSDGVALLMADKAIDCRPYDTTGESVDWIACSLRAWLNGDFYRSAFSEEEKARIVRTTLDCSWPDDKPVSQCIDRIFCLSPLELDKYVKGESSRCRRPTAYATRAGAFVFSEEGMPEYTGNTNYWLRWPAKLDYSFYVTFMGVVISHGVPTKDVSVCVCPAMRVRL